MLRYHYTEGNELGKRLHRVRKAAGMTLEDLADSLNKAYGTHANKGTISKYENGIHEPNASTIYCLSKILGVSVDFLLGKTDLDYPSLMAAISASRAEENGSEEASASDTQVDTAVAEQSGEPGEPANYSYDMPDNSMSPHYKIGDVLIVRTGVPVVNGRIYLVQYRRNHPMVREVVMESDKWILKPENHVFDQLELKYDPGVSDMPKDLKVFGKIIEFRRHENDAMPLLNP